MLRARFRHRCERLLLRRVASYSTNKDNHNDKGGDDNSEEDCVKDHNEGNFNGFTD